MKTKKNAVPIPQYNWGLQRQITENNSPSLTKQSEAAACDVNNIVRKYDRTGLLTHLQRSEAVFADVSHVTSYQDALIAVKTAQESFSDLPSGLRSRFENDPAVYLDWATQSTPEEKAELYAELTGYDRVEDARPEPPTPASADSSENGD